MVEIFWGVYFLGFVGSKGVIFLKKILLVFNKFLGLVINFIF